MGKDYKKLKIAFENDPITVKFLDLEEKIENIQERDKGDKGEDGIDGHTPTKEELLGLINPLIPQMPEVIHGKDGKDADEEKILKILVTRIPTVDEIISNIDIPKPPAVDVDNIIKRVITQIPKPDFPTIEEIIKEIKTKKLLELRDIKGARLDSPRGINMNDMRWHGGGLSNITGLIVAGSEIVITGSGTSIDPYIINATALASGITSINADTTTAQILAVGSAGVDFAIVNNGIGTHTFNLPTASHTNRGALSSTDWDTFNAKQNALTFGNLTDIGTDGITIGNGTGAVIGAGTSITQHVADTTHNGYLSSTDWNTFNNKGSGSVTSVASADGSINVTNPTTTVDLAVVKSPKLTTARTIGTITGDATSTGSSFDGTANNTNALTLATVNTNTGSWGSATQAPQFTVNGKGLITAAANVTITPAVGSITGLGTGVATALGVNVGTAGAFVVNGGALGTPSSGVATNLTGTASGLSIGGNAATATVLQTARTIAGVSFNGSANISIASTGLSDTANIAYLNASNLFTAGQQIKNDIGYLFINNAAGTGVSLLGTTKSFLGTGSVTDTALVAYKNLNIYTNGAVNPAMTLDTSNNLTIPMGNLTVGNGVGAFGNIITNGATFSEFQLQVAGVTKGYIFGDSNGISFLNSAGGYAITANTNGNVGINNPTPTSALSVNGLINMKNYTVATLPAGTRGDIAYVTDALAPSFLSIIVGGGATISPVFFNGTNWVGF